MARQIIDTGTLALNGSDGDTNRDAADKCNANFQELYSNNENFVRGAGVVPGGALVVFAGTTGNQVAAAPGGAPGTAAFKNTTDFASAQQGVKADNAQPKLSPGANITIDNTDPLNPVISAAGGGSDAVESVAGVLPVGGDVPAAELSTALGIDNKLDKTATAAAALKLANPRKINGVDFDGTAAITVADATKEPIIAAGGADQYWTGAKAWADFASSVRTSLLNGLSTATATVVTAADTVLVAIGKLQAQVSAKLDAGANAVSASKLFTARTINGVAFDGTANITLPASGASWGGITGTLSNQADLKSALDAKVSNSDIGYMYIYPNGGTPSVPYNIPVNTRLVIDNPFPGSPVIAQVELYTGGMWGEPGWDGNNGTGSNAYGVRSGHLPVSDKIIVQSGANGVLLTGSATGGLLGVISGVVTMLPVRVKVFKFKGVLA